MYLPHMNDMNHTLISALTTLNTPRSSRGLLAQLLNHLTILLLFLSHKRSPDDDTPPWKIGNYAFAGGTVIEA